MYSKEELIKLLQKAEKEIIPLTSDDFDEHSDYPSKSTIKRKFGSWSNGCEEANVDSGQVTRKSISDKIERLVKSGEVKNSEEFFNHTETPSPTTFYKKFDSWRDAIDNLNIEAFDEYKDEDLIQSLKEFYNEYGYISAYKFKYDKSYPSSTTVSSRFGSWNEAVKAADIEPNKLGVAGKEENTDKKRKSFGSNWNKRREYTLDRDGFQCRSCDSYTDLNVHHIKPRHTYRSSDVFDIEDSNSFDNLVTLCESCHYDAHRGLDVPENQQTTLKPRIV